MKPGEDRNKNRSAVADYVTVAIAEDMELAQEFRDVMIENDIPVAISTHQSYPETSAGVAVMVPEAYLEQAQELIESQQVFDDFLNDTGNFDDDFGLDDDY